MCTFRPWHVAQCYTAFAIRDETWLNGSSCNVSVLTMSYQIMPLILVTMFIFLSIPSNREEPLRTSQDKEVTQKSTILYSKWLFLSRTKCPKKSSKKAKVPSTTRYKVTPLDRWIFLSQNKLRKNKKQKNKQVKRYLLKHQPWASRAPLASSAIGTVCRGRPAVRHTETRVEIKHNCIARTKHQAQLRSSQSVLRNPSKLECLTWILGKDFWAGCWNFKSKTRSSGAACSKVGRTKKAEHRWRGDRIDAPMGGGVCDM